MNFKSFAAGAALSALALALAAQASAQTTIHDAGNAFAAGIAANGELYDNGTNTGLQRLSDFDPIRPGSARDSWGIAIAGGDAAYADAQFTGVVNITSTTLTPGGGGTNATALTLTGLGLTVSQKYSFVGAGNILKIDTVVTNTTSDALEALFQRGVDWNIDPTAFSEVVTGVYGGSGLVTDSSFFGFEDANPNVDYAASCRFDCEEGPADLGGAIKINLGTLLAGSSRHFSYFYGVNQAGDSLSQLVAQGHAAGAAYIIAGTSSERQDEGRTGVNSTFIGVSAVPEPAAWATMLVGFFGLGAAVRRRRAFVAS